MAPSGRVYRPTAAGGAGSADPFTDSIGDTGDLIDDYYIDPQLRNDQQLLFIVTATRRGVRRIELVPLLIDHMQVNRARGADFEAIKERIHRLSQAFGTQIRQEGDRLVVDVVQRW